MSRFRNQDFIRGTGEHQTRLLRAVAVGSVAVAILAFLVYGRLSPRIGQPDTLTLSLRVPAVAPGIHSGSKVILRGVEVGDVVGLTRYDDRTVRLDLELAPGEVRGLTDTFELDFRPANYFGVSAVNLVGRPNGRPLASGQVLDRTPVGDFTMSTMIEKGSLVVNGTLTRSMIDTLDEVIRYTDGLTPMIETGIVVANRISQTQQAMPSVLLADLNRTLEVLPSFGQQAVDTVEILYDNDSRRVSTAGSIGDEAAWWADMNEGIGLLLGGLFSSAGLLLSSHPGDLGPLTQTVTALTSAVPNLLDDGAAASKLAVLVDRYGNAFSGPDEAKTLNLRLILDDLPAFATPLAALGAPWPTLPEGPR
ncbi:hypothetical protein [Nocardia harenae]|uniref:hypothetical protein n=1 Tax=Nocardia harenae TaxID=358707 RepID=UPI0008347C72|nr:hypothetical protein [Nocardia harenae]